MAREEEIKEASINYTMKNRPYVLAGDRFSEEMSKFNRNKAFEEGAKWADKTMIEKACNWLKDRISIPYEGNYNEDGEPIASDYINFAMERLKKAEEICNDFHKAMEE